VIALDANVEATDQPDALSISALKLSEFGWSMAIGAPGPRPPLTSNDGVSGKDQETLTAPHPAWATQYTLKLSLLGGAPVIHSPNSRTVKPHLAKARSSSASEK
jgi:hypothetical protein